jgi:5-methyltetrahydropteroyltriglutamate--homocysteine methyltransferase
VKKPQKDRLMRKSEERILTTHVGSLPRPPKLRELLIRQERGETIDPMALEREAEAAVRHVVQKQMEAGIDIGNDGEQPRVGFSTYVTQRMRGFGGSGQRPPARDLMDFPDYAAMLEFRRRGAARITHTPQALAAVEYTGLDAASRECDLFLRCASALARPFSEYFMTAASPGIIATTMLNAYYDSHQRYVFALAEQMRQEYELIHSRGFLLQLDCPDLAMERTRLFQQEPLERFQEIVALHIDAINMAVANIPPERIRLHVCWGNNDGPHIYDVPLEAILPLLYRANVGALSIELANPRHQHEYKVLKRHPLPDSMLFLPGVIDSTTNFVEHPEVVADRICQVVEAIGDRTRVIASVDCGFGTFAGAEMVAESVVWAKLQTLQEGASLASRRLWG